MSAPLSDAKRQLLEKMMRGQATPAAKPQPIAPRAPDAPIPLSADQRQVWLHAIMAPDTPLYNESITIHRFGSFDRTALERSVNEILRRHEAWRTAFREEDGVLVQRVREHRDIALPYDDVGHLPEAKRDEAARLIGQEDARRPIDLADAPLFRARIVRLADDNHRLYLTLHHIIFDGVSIYRVIVPELAALYAAFAVGAPSPLPPPALQYGDYAVWQQEHLQSPQIRQQLEHWRRTLADAPAKLEVIGDRAKPAQPTHAGSMETFLVPTPLIERLKAVSRSTGVTLYMTLLASYHALLHRYTGEEDIVVGGVTDLRRRPELERTVGYFLNTIALRAKPRGETPFATFLHEVRESVLGALAASEVPFDEVVCALDLPRQPGAHPLFDCLFSIEPPVEPFPAGWDLTQMDVVVGGAKFDLYLELDERPDGMHGRFLYSTEKFDPATIRRMIGHWLNILQAVVEDMDQPLAALPLLDAAELHRLLIDWNDTAVPTSAELLPDALRAAARYRPDATAIRCGDLTKSYAALHERAGAIAAALAAAGLGRGDLVGVCLDRTPDMVAALLAIHHIGAAYLPLDPDFPPARLDFIVRDAGAAALLSERRLDRVLADSALPRLLVDDMGPAEAPPIAQARPEDLAYVLYTSGSTGNPKGVEIEHGALINLLAAFRDLTSFGAADTLLAVTTLSFDIAALELFLPLLTGGTLVLAPRTTAVDPRRLDELFREVEPTVMQATPATWRALVETGWQGSPALRLLCGGEALPRDLAGQLLARCGTLWNVYGPTETTIWSTAARVTSGEGPVPIGRPLANTTLRIVDRYGSVAPIGIVGELLIGGAGLARGYRNRPDLTAERFVTMDGERFYRTGDLARYQADGTLLCLGRTDNDEKIRGYRVAVEEIEGALASHPLVAAAAVRSWPDASGERALAAYLVTSQAQPLPPRAALVEHLARTLPQYMIPSHFVALDALPMTPNEKVDRRRLPPLDPASAEAIEPPLGDTEQRLAAIWRTLLRTDAVGRDDSFFALGGHSLLVAQLLVRVEQEWGRRIGMADFFRALTLRQLAARIDDEQAVDAGDIVTLQPRGQGLPLLWIDGGPIYLALAQAMGQERPFLGLPLGPVLARVAREGMTFEEIASAIVGVLRANRPHGPYLLGGWCTNGIMAFEVARQLRASGEEVPLLALGHTMNPVAFQRITAGQMRLSKARYHLQAWNSLPLGEKAGYAVSRARGLLEEAGMAQAPVFDGPYARFAKMMERAAYGYHPGPYDGAVALFQPADRLGVLDGRPGWAEVVRGPLAAYDIPGTHGTMHQPPYVAHFAAALREAIAGVLDEHRVAA